MGLVNTYIFKAFFKLGQDISEQHIVFIYLPKKKNMNYKNTVNYI